MKYLYLLLNILTISIPFLYSFDARINYAKKWKYLFPAIFLTAAFFITWDIIFTNWKIWSFNDHYLTGINLINLPIEEWLFFIAIPYSSVFIYESMNYFITKDYLGGWIADSLSIIMSAALLLIASIHLNLCYTAVTFLLTAAFLLTHLFMFRTTYMGRFFLSYLIILIPFFIVNGILTGGITQEPVVLYNDAHNLCIRMGTIPIEDTVYGFLLILMNVTIYEHLKAEDE